MKQQKIDEKEELVKQLRNDEIEYAELTKKLKSL